MGVLIGFSVVYWLASCLIAKTKLFWYDELATYYPATLPTVRDTWSFFGQGYDLHTPIASLFVRATMALFGQGELAARLPVIFFFWLMCVCIYAFVSHRSTKAFGLAAMVFPCITSVFYYATEARPYGILLGSSAAALLCWQRASEALGRRRAWWLFGLWISVALSVSAHYLGILLLVALFAGEFTRIAKTKRIDWPVIVTLVAGALPLLLFVPMAIVGKNRYASGFWARPHLSDIENAYREFLTLAFAPWLGALLLWGLLALFRGSRIHSENKRAPVPETVAIVILALLPVYYVPISFVLHSFVSRHILFTIVGVTTSLAYLAYRSSRGDRLLATVLLIVFFGWFVVKVPSSIHANLAQSGNSFSGPLRPFADADWALPIERSQLPIAVTPAVFFLQLQHYADPDLKPRIVYPTSVAAALQYDRSNTGELHLNLLAHAVSLNLPRYEEFVSSHPHFLLCADTTNPTWLIRKLIDDGAQLRLITRQDSYFVFEVNSNRQ